MTNETAWREAVLRLLNWVEPIAGDNCDKKASEEELASLEAVKSLLQSPSQPVVAEAVNWKDMSWEERYRNLLQEYRELSDRACEYAAAHPQASPPPVQSERAGEPVGLREALGRIISLPTKEWSIDTAKSIARAALAHSQPDTQDHIAGKMVAALTSELATVKKRLESAEDALRPFAMALHEWGDDAGQPDRWNVWEHPIANGVTLGDFRSAAHFLQEQEKQNG